MSTHKNQNYPLLLWRLSPTAEHPENIAIFSLMSVTKLKWPHDNMFSFCIHISYNFFIFFGKNKLFTWEYPVMITKLLPCCFDSSLRITITKELLKCHHIHCHHCRPWICPRTCRPCSLPWSSSRRRNWWTCAGCCSREICRIHSCAPTRMNQY